MIYLFDFASGNIDICLCEEDMADKRRICSCSSEFPWGGVGDSRAHAHRCGSPRHLLEATNSRGAIRLGENQGPQVFEDVRGTWGIDVRRFRIQVSVISRWKYLNPVDQMSLDEHLVRPTGNNIWRVGIGWYWLHYCLFKSFFEQLKIWIANLVERPDFGALQHCKMANTLLDGR